MLICAGVTCYVFFTQCFQELWQILVFLILPLSFYQFVYGVKFVGVVKDINQSLQSHMRNVMGIWIHNTIIMGIGVGNIFSIGLLFIRKRFVGEL